MKILWTGKPEILLVLLVLCIYRDIRVILYQQGHSALVPGAVGMVLYLAGVTNRINSQGSGWAP